MPKIIISLDNKKLKSYLSFSRIENFRYIYIGERDNDIVDLLSKKSFVEIEDKKHDSSFKEYFCKEYIDLVGTLGLKYSSVYWWATFVSSKNRFASGLANTLFSLYATGDKIKKYKGDNILIICHDVAVAESLRKYLIRHNIQTILFKNRLTIYMLCVVEPLKTLFSVGIFIFRIWKKIFISKQYLKGLLKEKIKNRFYYVIKTFIYDSSFDTKGEYHDSFFGILPEYLREKKETLIIADIIGNYRKCVNNIKNNHAFLRVPLEYLISYIDPVKSALMTFINKIVIREEINFLDFEVSNIVNSEIIRDYKMGNPFLHYLYYIYIKRLLKLVKIEKFIFTYENNPWERMCVFALRQYSASTKIIGYQHTVVPQASANMFISKCESGIVPLPDKILTVGKVPKDIMERYGFYQKGRIEESCALRFEYLFKIPTRPRSKSGNILVALEGIYEVYKLVNYVLEEMKDLNSFSIKIRTHPVLPLSYIRHKIKYSIENLSHISLSDKKPPREDIEESDMVIYWGSTVALEALMMGKPIIHFDTGSILSYDPLFENRHLKWVVTENDKLPEVIRQIYALDDKSFYEQQKCAREYMENYFYKIDESCLQKFLN